MHTEYLQSLREKLQKRIRRVKSSKWEQYTAALQQLWSFFDSEPTLVAVAQELEARFPGGANIANEIEKLATQNKFPMIGIEGDWAAASYRIMRKFANEDPRNVRKFIPMQSSTSFDANLNAFSSYYVEPFHDYVDERLDDPRFVLAQLIRFKHLCEWFWRSNLFSGWDADQSRGERFLGLKLYEFLFAEGIHIQIEPWSISGEVDLIGSQEGPDRLLADVKIFNQDKNKGGSYIVQGFRQVYQYAADYNQPIAYLIIFNTCNKHLRIATSGRPDLIPQVVVNHKTVYFLVIDLYPHETSASKRPQTEAVEITEDQIVAAATQAAS
jgi:hypothetical protein